MGINMKKIITAIANAAFIISIALAVQLPQFIRYIIAVAGVLALIVLLYYDKNSQLYKRMCTSQEEINTAMKEIVSILGKVCIMSRDLSWVTPDIFKILTEKKSDVLIFAQNETDLTKQLSAGGATVQYYGKYGFEPVSRFTAIRYNRDYPQVAIAKTQNTMKKSHNIKHIIYQTGINDCIQDQWINALAIDMISLCKAVCKEERNEKC